MADLEPERDYVVCLVDEAYPLGKGPADSLFLLVIEIQHCFSG